MNRVSGKVAVVTGAARGQGRSHAVHLADEGADIIALDICEDIATNDYAMARKGDLDETAKLVEKAGRRVVTAVADVRDRAALKKAIDDGVAELGGLHIVVANAGICPHGEHKGYPAFRDVFDVNFLGVINTVNAAFDHLGTGASIIATGSIAGLVPQHDMYNGGGNAGPGGLGYGLAKKFVRDWVKSMAMTLAARQIRVNAVHPTNVNTAMMNNPMMYKTFRPDLEAPTHDEAFVVYPILQAMPVPWVQPEDISHAVVYLASDESRYVTGLQMYVDAGAALKMGF
ncbi:mycofactocin-coupled SDR family oxidoreductase [Mycobacterium sp. HNNTM2301]|uniref:mycofactocin-coupled SDR family oxidoreductase n=1 Tax=Mycobacterium hainanense TaxID=3289775 RepID=UPI0035A5ACE0